MWLLKISACLYVHWLFNSISFLVEPELCRYNDYHCFFLPVYFFAFSVRQRTNFQGKKSFLFEMFVTFPCWSILVTSMLWHNNFPNYATCYTMYAHQGHCSRTTFHNQGYKEMRTQSDSLAYCNVYSYTKIFIVVFSALYCPAPCVLMSYVPYVSLHPLCDVAQLENLQFYTLYSSLYVANKPERD